MRFSTAAPDLVALPKAHLHLHLIGSMRPSTLADLAAAAGVPVPPPVQATGPLGWARFDAFYCAAKDLVRRPQDLVRLVHELAEDEAADGSGWVEVTANPALYGSRFGPPEAVLELLLDAGRAATARSGVGIGWVVSADRRHPDQALGLARLAACHAGAGVVGFGLANDERRNPAEHFAAAFRLARGAGLAAVPHAGELCGAAAVADAVDVLGARRVGHGVRIVEDPALLARVVGAGVHLELCPSSNLALGVVGSSREHPLPALVAAGASVSLSADDPLLFGSRLTDQYVLARSMGLDDDALADLALASVVHALAPPATQRRLAAGIAAWRQDRRQTDTPARALAAA